MDFVIENIDQVTTTWLTNALRKSGCLPKGEVESFSKDQSRKAGFTSARYHLELVYTENERNSAPEHLFLKIGKPEHFNACKNEIVFYEKAKPFHSALPLLKCYDASYSSDNGQSHLLLQDISKSHFNPDLAKFHTDLNTPIPLTQSDCEQVIECLAVVHASCWNDPSFGKESGFHSNKAVLNFSLKNLEDGMPAIFDALGDGISPERRRLYEHALSVYPALYLHNIEAGAPLTLIHGDAHIGNFMFPNEPNENHTILLDWQSCRVEVGVDDLAHLMVLNWYPNQRNMIENTLLLYYHDQLLKRGIENYSLDDCWLGYRLAAIWMLFVPILWFSHGLPLWLCWHNIEKGYQNFQDLQCIELLDS